MASYINLPGPIINSNSSDSAGSVNGNIDLIRLLIGNGNETRILDANGGVLSIESFFQNINRYGNTFSNKFFVLIDGPGFVNSPSPLNSIQKYTNLSEFGEFLPAVGGIAGGIEGQQINTINSRPVTDSDSYSRLSVLCNSASFPKTDIASSKLELIPSMQESVAQYRNFAENSTFTLKFYNSSSMFERNYFESWMNTVVNMKTGIANYYDEYAKPFSISVLKLPRNSFGPDVVQNLFGKKTVRVENGMGGSSMDGYIYGVKYMECYPISINNVEFSYGQSALTETEITFAYKYYLSPSNIKFLNSEINPSSSYQQYLSVLSQIINNKGKVSYDPQNNNTDRLASAINGTVNRVTNVVAAIQQIY